MPGGLGAFALIVVAGVVALAFMLVWLLSRDRDVVRTSFGFYVERRRHSERGQRVVSDPEPEEKVTERKEWPQRGYEP